MKEAGILMVVKSKSIFQTLAYKKRREWSPEKATFPYGPFSCESDLANNSQWPLRGKEKEEGEADYGTRDSPLTSELDSWTMDLGCRSSKCPQIGKPPSILWWFCNMFQNWSCFSMLMSWKWSCHHLNKNKEDIILGQGCVWQLEIRSFPAGKPSPTGYQEFHIKTLAEDAVT